MRNKNNHHWTSSQIIIWVGLLVLFMIFATAFVWNSFHKMETVVDSVYVDVTGRGAHVVFIPEEQSDDVMQSVLKSVREQAEKEEIYVECIGEELSETYSKQELLELAIAAKVDGIILEGDNSLETWKLIADANEKGIPVVTVRSDCSGSDRRSFVGVNNYTLGHSYGNQILNLSYHKPIYDVVILMDQSTVNSGQNIVYSSLCQTLEESTTGKFNIHPIQIARELTFEAEEQIRNLFVDDELPDIVVCLSQLYTNCAVQALIDQNKVGKTELIGFYDNVMIREAIQDNVLRCSISIDTAQMGRYLVEALNDIWETGQVSEYYSVDTFLINKDTDKEPQV